MCSLTVVYCARCDLSCFSIKVHLCYHLLLVARRTFVYLFTQHRNHIDTRSETPKRFTYDHDNARVVSRTSSGLMFGLIVLTDKIATIPDASAKSSISGKGMSRSVP